MAELINRTPKVDEDVQEFSQFHRVTLPNGEVLKSSTIEFRRTHGERLYKDGDLEIVAPYNPDLSPESGLQVQVVNPHIKNYKLGESPLLSPKVPPGEIIAVARLGLAAEEWLLKKTDQAWVNYNFHTRPPLNPLTTVDAQYDDLTLDIHGRDINDPRNWTRPPATHGLHGLPLETLTRDEERRDMVDTIDHNGIAVDYSAYKKDPEPNWEEFPPNPANSEDFEGWENHRSGFYYEGGRRTHTVSEMRHLIRIYKEGTFAERAAEIKNLPLFSEEILVNPDFEKSEHFPSNETDMVLFECTVGERAYQVVTQKTPLTDREDGIHMVVKLRPEPHTPWDNPTQALEALSIGIGLARIFQKNKVLKDHEQDGEIGDAYFDFNANWSMTKKRDLLETHSLHEVKEAIQKDTRAHLHVQFEKMNAHWEIPPAPGTFSQNKPQTQETIHHIRRALADKETGLAAWLNESKASL